MRFRCQLSHSAITRIIQIPWIRIPLQTVRLVADILFEPFALKQKIENTHRLIMNRWAVCAICTFQVLGQIMCSADDFARQHSCVFSIDPAKIWS